MSNSAFFFCSVNCKSDLEIINLILDILRYVVSPYISRYLVLSYIEKLISTVDIFSYFLLVNISLCSIISGI